MIIIFYYIPEPPLVCAYFEVVFALSFLFIGCVEIFHRSGALRSDVGFGNLGCRAVPLLLISTLRCLFQIEPCIGIFWRRNVAYHFWNFTFRSVRSLCSYMGDDGIRAKPIISRTCWYKHADIRMRTFLVYETCISHNVNGVRRFAIIHCIFAIIHCIFE